MLKITECKKGDRIYVCGSGYNIEYRVLTDPYEEDPVNNPGYWVCEGEDIVGAICHIGQHQKHRHYCQIYDRPAYDTFDGSTKTLVTEVTSANGATSRIWEP